MTVATETSRKNPLPYLGNSFRGRIPLPARNHLRGFRHFATVFAAEDGHLHDVAHFQVAGLAPLGLAQGVILSEDRGRIPSRQSDGMCG